MSLEKIIFLEKNIKFHVLEKKIKKIHILKKAYKYIKIYEKFLVNTLNQILFAWEMFVLFTLSFSISLYEYFSLLSNQKIEWC